VSFLISFERRRSSSSFPFLQPPFVQIYVLMQFVELLPVVKIHSVHSAVYQFLNFYTSLFLSCELQLLLVKANLLDFKNFLLFRGTKIAKGLTRFFRLLSPLLLELLIIVERAVNLSHLGDGKLLVLIFLIDTPSVGVRLRVVVAVTVLLAANLLLLFIDIEIFKVKVFHRLICIDLVNFNSVHDLLLSPLLKLLVEYSKLLRFVLRYQLIINIHSLNLVFQYLLGKNLVNLILVVFVPKVHCFEPEIPSEITVILVILVYKRFDGMILVFAFFLVTQVKFVLFHEI
jgi:hypothetical protein